MNIMDFDSFLEEMDGDLDAVNMIVGELVKAIKTQLPIMSDLYTNKDYHTLNREAHSIKGGASNLMAFDLGAVAKQLEFAAADQNDVLIERYMASLIVEFENFKSYVNTKL